MIVVADLSITSFLVLYRVYICLSSMHVFIIRTWNFSFFLDVTESESESEFDLHVGVPFSSQRSATDVRMTKWLSFAGYD